MGRTVLERGTKSASIYDEIAKRGQNYTTADGGSRDSLITHEGLIVSEEEPEVEGQEEGLTTELWDKYRFGFFLVLINVYFIWV